MIGVMADNIPRRSVARTAKLATIPLGAAGRAAKGLGLWMMGHDKDEISHDIAIRTAEQIFRVLGGLKGGAMKVGQAMSLFEAGMPEELAEPFSEALTRLQADAPPMPTRTVHRVLERQLGLRWRERFREFSDEPTAAASIGQVHSAVWADGREVAVKVQYPGAESALRSDLHQLRRMAPLLRLLSPGSDLGALVDEIRARLTEELDYRIEANNQRVFAAAFRDSEDIVIPGVLAASPHVLVTEWVHGTSFANVIAKGGQEERNRAAELLTVFQFASPEVAHMMHTDPHPGNFFLLDDGRLGVIDFGSAIGLPDGLPSILTSMVRLAVAHEADALVELMTRAGYVAEGAESIDPAEAMHFLAPFAEPMTSHGFHFTREWMRTITSRYAHVHGREFRTSRSFALPAEYLMIHRVLASSVAMLCQLEAEAPYREIILRWQPEMLPDQ